MRKYSSISEKEMADSGQALVLLALILFLFLGGRGWVWAALAFLVLNMACPRLFHGFAFVWLNFSHCLGAVVSRVLLTAQFFLLVLPVGLFRRLLGKDSLALKKWRAGNESVFVVRDHRYEAKDLKNPY